LPVLFLGNLRSGFVDLDLAMSFWSKIGILMAGPMPYVHTLIAVDNKLLMPPLAVAEMVGSRARRACPTRFMGFENPVFRSDDHRDAATAIRKAVPPVRLAVSVVGAPSSKTARRSAPAACPAGGQAVLRHLSPSFELL